MALLLAAGMFCECWKITLCNCTRPMSLLQDAYWNYGAASAKYVAPGHRAHGRNGAAVPMHLAVKEACYTWDETAAAVRSVSCRLCQISLLNSSLKCRALFGATASPTWLRRQSGCWLCLYVS